MTSLYQSSQVDIRLCMPTANELVTTEISATLKLTEFPASMGHRPAVGLNQSMG